MKRIIYTRPDGGVCVVLPVISKDDPDGFTEDDAVQRALSKDVPPGAIAPQVVDASAIPLDRAQRRAWRQNGAAVEVDQAKAVLLKNDDATSAIDGMDRLQFEHLFELENRTRVLELKPQITRPQYKEALVARWKALNQ